MNLENAEVYDIETFPNAFTFYMEQLNSNLKAVWEISDYRDDRRTLIEHFNWLNQTQTPMVGFNNVHFDYPIIHFIFCNPNATVRQIYDKAMAIITSNDRFGHTIWANDRFAPQIDLFKINHFDNPAKSTSLKALQINMRSPSVVDMPVEVGTILTKEQVDNFLIPYNGSDVQKTKNFTLLNKDALNFRLSLIDDFGIDVMNWSDTKIGSKMMEKKIGYELCYDYSSGRKQTRQTPRAQVNLSEIIFPYILFEHPEFQRIHTYLYNQVLKSEEIKQFSDSPPKVKTKGVFTNLKATVGGIDFHFGTGGIHGSIEKKCLQSTEEWLIRDIDVASLYPSIAIINNLAPEHLGEQFTKVYSELPKERKRWQAEKGKKCVEANTLKLASNGVYGNSNNIYSPFYDPKFTMSITVNGQLLLCMLAERLLTVPTLKLIQVNTDGITYYIHKNHEPQAAAVCKAWEDLTALTLESADYSRMWIRDVNSYVAESPDGSLKLKGAYWTPDPLNYHASVSEAQPPAWHKDLGNVISVRAAVAAMVHGIDPETFIHMSTNPYDFMCRIKVKRSDNLFYGGKEIQRNTRYYVSTNGFEMIKVAPPPGDKKEGAYKKANGVTEEQYKAVMLETGGKWDARVCTKNKNVYEQRKTAVQAGHKLTVCNDVKDFNFENVNYTWYINEAKKLIL